MVAAEAFSPVTWRSDLSSGCFLEFPEGRRRDRGRLDGTCTDCDSAAVSSYDYPGPGRYVAGLMTLHLELVYNPDVLTPTEVILTPGLSDALLEYAVDSPGRLVVGLIEPRGHTGDGALLQVVFEVGQTDEASLLGLERLEAFGGDSFIDIPTSSREGVYRAAENEFDAPVIVFGR